MPNELLTVQPDPVIDTGHPSASASSSTITDKEAIDRAQFAEMLDDYLPPTLVRGHIHEATIISRKKGGVLVEMDGFDKGPVFLPTGEKEEEEPQSSGINGERISVVILNRDSDDEVPIVHNLSSDDESIPYAIRVKHFYNKLIETAKVGDEVSGRVVRVTNTGAILVAMGNGVKAVIPRSQLSQDYDDPESLIGQELSARIMLLDPEDMGPVLSQKPFDSSIIREKNKLGDLRQLEVGSISQGTVTSIADYGVFVDNGNVRGLVHISELSPDSVNHPSDLVKIGDVFPVQVTSVDMRRKQVGFSRKKLIPDPWETIGTDYQVGQRVLGKVVFRTDNGWLVRLREGLTGYVRAEQLHGTVASLKPGKVTSPIFAEVIIQVINPNEKTLWFSSGNVVQPDDSS